MAGPRWRRIIMSWLIWILLLNLRYGERSARRPGQSATAATLTQRSGRERHPAGRAETTSPGQSKRWRLSAPCADSKLAEAARWDRKCRQAAGMGPDKAAEADSPLPAALEYLGRRRVGRDSGAAR